MWTGSPATSSEAPSTPTYFRRTIARHREAVTDRAEERVSRLLRLNRHHRRACPSDRDYAASPTAPERDGRPGHDQRDFEFATEFGLPIAVVVAPPGWNGEPLAAAYVDPGTMVASGQFDGMPSEEAKEAIARHLEDRGQGGPTVTYRLRDWLISRQRYWGAPIPIVYCGRCGEQPVPDGELPVELPYTSSSSPTGESRSGGAEGFSTPPSVCGGAAPGETDTMTPSWCSWDFMRYCDRTTRSTPSRRSPRELAPGDRTRRLRHATMPLYARFFYKAARDAGLVPGDELTRYSAGADLGPAAAACRVTREGRSAGHGRSSAGKRRLSAAT